MPKHLDEPTFLAHLAAFQTKPSPDAALALAAEADDRALPALVKAMTDIMEGPDVARYREAVRMLATPAVLTDWLARDVPSRRVAAHALTARIPEHAVLIGMALVDDDDQVRAIARRTLRSWTASPQVRELFLSALHHADPRVRFFAAEGLGKLHKKEDLDLLRTALENETDDRARDRISWAVEKIEGSGD
jgi:HEAT repeat protein